MRDATRQTPADDACRSRWSRPLDRPLESRYSTAGTVNSSVGNGLPVTNCARHNSSCITAPAHQNHCTHRPPRLSTRADVMWCAGGSWRLLVHTCTSRPKEQTLVFHVMPICMYERGSYPNPHRSPTCTCNWTLQSLLLLQAVRRIQNIRVASCDCSMRALQPDARRLVPCLTRLC